MQEQQENVVTSGASPTIGYTFVAGAVVPDDETWLLLSGSCYNTAVGAVGDEIVNGFGDAGGTFFALCNYASKPGGLGGLSVSSFICDKPFFLKPGFSYGVWHAIADAGRSSGLNLQVVKLKI